MRRIALKRTQPDEVLRVEGLRDREEDTWFGERIDPEFAANTGRRTARHRTT